MPRQIGISVENNFSRGLITEATGLNFPENACTETYDCIFDKTGEVYRRSGIQLESLTDVHSVDTFADSAITEYLWKSVSLTGEIMFVVLQVGRIVSFFQVDADGLVSPELKDFSVNLDVYKIAGAPSVTPVNASFASGNGQLFITHPYCSPVFVEYDVDTDTIETREIRIKIRDMWGLPNTPIGSEIPYPVSYRIPETTGISANIMYNYLNQGWEGLKNFNLDRRNNAVAPLLLVWREGGSFFNQPNGPYPYGRPDWPSEADFPAAFRASGIPATDENGNPLDPIPPAEAFSLPETDGRELGSSPAPKGYYIYDAFYIDRWLMATTGVTYGITEGPRLFANLGPTPAIETSGYARPSQSAFFAGRAWYAGVHSPKYNTKIYFSKIIEGSLKYDECYQQQDPTAADVASTDLLPSDGGVVIVPDISKIIKLVPFGASLLVFATNGVWSIAGSAQGAGFTANDYGVHRLSAVGAISALNFVDADGTPIWWNSDGIYSIRQEGVNPPQAISLTNNTIQTFFDAIPVENRRWVKGAYNKNTKTVQWLYRSSEITTVAERYRYDRVLNLDLNTGTFYPWTISDSCLYVAGITVLDGFGSTFIQETVTDDEVDVTDDGDLVTEAALTLADISSRFKYLTFNECSDIDPGEVEAESSLTYNRNFYGHLNGTTFASGGNADALTGGVMIGEDGKYYIPTEANATPAQSALIQFNSDGTSVKVDYTIDAIKADILSIGHTTASGIPVTGLAAHKRIIPIPFTQYFYYQTAGAIGLSYTAFFALYKVNSSGNIEFMNRAKAYSGHHGQVGHSNLMYFGAVDYETWSGDREDSNLLVAYTSVSFLGGNFTRILRLPSLNTFLDLIDTSVGTFTALWTGYADDWKMFGNHATYNAETSTSSGCFFLPTGTTTQYIYKYVDYATAQAHVDNYQPSSQVTAIDTLAASNTEGFVMRSPITTASWTVVTSSFDDIPTDGLDRGGAAGNKIYNDWTQPFHQYDEDGNRHLLTWTRRYTGSETNQTTLGTFTLVKVDLWNPDSEVAILAASTDAETAGGPFDSDVDLEGSVGVTKYGSYPRQRFGFVNLDVDEVFIWDRYDGSSPIVGNNYALAKFGDLVLAEVVDVPTGTMGWSEFSNGDFIDWPEVTVGFNYESYFTSGYKVRGEAMRKFQSNYMQLYSRNSNPSTYDVHGKWDYSNSGNTGRWSSVQRVTQEDTNYAYRNKRLKMRGHGKALQFKVSSVDNEPFNIIGWSILETTNASI